MPQTAFHETPSHKTALAFREGGRMASYIRETDDEGTLIYTNPDFKVDAARIYISQKADIDDYFNLRSGKVGTSRAKSGIGIKADALRLIGREGIKLVTRTEPQNSQGGKLQKVNGIDLIAGNDDSDMQPLIKGANLTECLDDMNDNIANLNGILFNI